jgi:hypothetical protein
MLDISHTGGENLLANVPNDIRYWEGLSSSKWLLDQMESFLWIWLKFPVTWCALNTVRSLGTMPPDQSLIFYPFTLSSFHFLVSRWIAAFCVHYSRQLSVSFLYAFETCKRKYAAASSRRIIGE